MKKYLSALLKFLSHKCNHRKLQTPKSPLISCISESTAHSLLFALPSFSTSFLLWFIISKITNILNFLSELLLYLLALVTLWLSTEGTASSFKGYLCFFFFSPAVLINSAWISLFLTATLQVIFLFINPHIAVLF